MTKSLRPGKVLVDWSQNNAAKTTVSVYSLRARPTATVSTPVTWDEVGAAAEGAPLSFTQADVLARIADGDLFEPLLRDPPAGPPEGLTIDGLPLGSPAAAATPADGGAPFRPVGVFRRRNRCRSFSQP